MVIATGRLLIASLLLTPIAFAVRKKALSNLSRRDLTASFVSGIFLGLHFFTWISSLEHTSVASSVLFVATNPIFVAIGAILFFRERLSGLLIVSILISIMGSIIIGADDLSQGGTGVLYGNVLAIIGAITHSAYLLIGQRLRVRLDNISYITVVYGSAAIVLTIAAIILGTDFSGYSSYTWLMIALLAVGPQLIGHSSYNWALRYVSATVIAIMILAEPIGASILAYVFLDEGVSAIKIAGGLIVLFGIYLAVRSTQRSAMSDL